MSNKIWIILGMCLVTYIPRVLPLYCIDKIKLRPKWKLFLTYIPYTALGALIIPGAFSATPSIPLAGMLGLLFVCLYSWVKGGIIIPVLGSVIITFSILIMS